MKQCTSAAWSREEQLEQAISKYQNLLREQGAEQIEIQHRGKRRLAYEINKQRDGIYIQMNYQGPGTSSALRKGDAFEWRGDSLSDNQAGSFWRNARITWKRRQRVIRCGR